MDQKAEHLHIRASHSDKAILLQAARARRMSVSQFVLRTALPVAEQVVRDEAGVVDTQFKLNPNEWNRFMALLDAPTRDLPELKRLFEAVPPWEEPA